MTTDKNFSEISATRDDVRGAYIAHFAATEWLLKAWRSNLSPARLDELEALQAKGSRVVLRTSKHRDSSAVAVDLIDQAGGLLPFDIIEMTGHVISMR